MSTTATPSVATRDQAFQTLADKETVSKAIVKTKMCQETMKGKKCYRKNCGFAHSKAELSLPKCLFGDSCRTIKDPRKPCCFVHPCDTAATYKTRTGQEWPLDIVVPPLKVSAKKLTEHEVAMQQQMKYEEEFIAHLRQLEAEEEKARQDRALNPHLYPEPEVKAPEESEDDDSEDDSEDEDDGLVIFITREDKLRWEAQQEEKARLALEAEQAQAEADAARIEAERLAADAAVLADKVAEMQISAPSEEIEMYEEPMQPVYYCMPPPPRNVVAVLTPEQFAYLYPQFAQMGVYFQAQ